MSTMTVRSREIFPQQRAALVRRVEAIFRAMSTDFLLREQFVTNPAQILAEYVHGKESPARRATVANRLIYAVMAYPRLLAWLRDYAARHRANPPTQERALRDFAHAVVDLGAHKVALALASSRVAGEPINFEETCAVLFGGAGNATGYEAITGSVAPAPAAGPSLEKVGGGLSVALEDERADKTSTYEQMAGKAATLERMGAALATIAQPGKSAATLERPGVELATKGTLMQPGSQAATLERPGVELATKGTLMQPGSQAATLERSGVESATKGTLMQPGSQPATLESVAAATSQYAAAGAARGEDEMLAGGILGSAYANVTLEALSQYAAQLMAIGALDAVAEA